MAVWLGILALLALAAVTLLWPQSGPVSASDVAAVAAGSASDHTCAVSTAGGLQCWGRNDYGQLGDGTTIDRTTPVDVVGLESGVSAVATGGSHSCALAAAGGLTCWGRNTYGQLGDGRACGIVCVTPVDVLGLESGLAGVTAGSAHTCALTTAGGAKCWGNNFHGQLGNGQVGNFRTTPVGVGLLASGVAALAAGDWHTCAVTTVGGVKCWGENLNGQLGDGTFGTNRPAPVNVIGLSSGVAAVAGGELHSCGLTNAGAVKCWGRNDVGQVGDGTVSSIRTAPADVVDLSSDVVAIAVGGRHTCAVTATGGAKCWGYNASGQLGDGTTMTRFTPVDVLGLAGNAIAIAGGHSHTCGVVQCWGGNVRGTLGDDQACGTICSAPVNVVGLGPKPVGGIAEQPEVAGQPLATGGSSGPGAGMLFGMAVGIAVGAVALGVAARYARMRWRSSR